jgi:uncharacterized protein YdcH (DUF465 family)
MPSRLSDEDIILIVRLCHEHEKLCEQIAADARARNDYREAALQYQRKEQYVALKDKLMRSSRISAGEIMARLQGAPDSKKE